MNKLTAKLGIGPMSSETIEAVVRYSNYHRKQLMFIASKNQIDHSGGYVNGWNTKDYVSYIKELTKIYTNSDIKICRDHCGPGFNGNYDLKDTYKTIETDIANGFDLIHIDFCHFKGGKDEQLLESKNAIAFAQKLNPKILIEIGTDENAGVKYSLPNISEIDKEIDYFQEVCNPEFYVVQSGSLIKEINQVGTFNSEFIRQIFDLTKSKDIKLKEHNADYLDRDALLLRQGVVDALNVAPQYGVVQTQIVLSKCLIYGIDTTDYLNECYHSQKWSKWLSVNTADNKLLCSVIAGHYNFNTKSYKAIIDKLNQYEDIKETIINHLMEIIHHYDN